MIPTNSLGRVIELQSNSMSREMSGSLDLSGMKRYIEGGARTLSVKPAPEKSAVFKAAQLSDRPQENKLLGLLYCQPSHDLSKSEIVKNMSYFHHRSGKNIDFYCAGYGAGSPSSNENDHNPVISIDGIPWYFSAAAFNSFREEIETLSKWRYGGEVELLLLNSYIDLSESKLVLDFSSTILCKLDEMKRLNAIDSVMQFFEEVFRYAEDRDSSDPAWGFSDQQGGKKAFSALKRFLLSLLPGDLGDEVTRVLQHTVVDVSR